MSKWTGILGLAAVAGLAAPRAADAALTLTLSEPGYSSYTTTDLSNTGVIQFFGTYGDFQTNFVAGLSNKLTLPTPSSAVLQITSIDVTNLSATPTTKTLSITLTDDGFTFPGGTGSLASLDSSFGGTITTPSVGDSVTFQSAVVTPSTTTGLQTYTAVATGLPTLSFNSNVVPVTFARPASFTLTNTIGISLTGLREQTNLSGTTTVSAVPEPAVLGTVVAAGLGLLGRRRRR